MIRPLKIAHTSDVHLHDGEGKERVRTAFTRVVDEVLESGAELFLIAGDLYDHNRVKGESIDYVYDQLSRLSCPTVIIAGNHDCFDAGKSVLRDMDFTLAGEHVHMLNEIEGKHIELHAGAGIVAGSDPEHELAETEAKIGTLLAALRAAPSREASGCA